MEKEFISNKSKKKILVLASTFPRWKDDTTPPFVYELERRLTDTFDIHVLVPHHKGAKKYEVMDGLEVHRFQYFWPAGMQKLCYEGGILPNIKKNKLLLFQGFSLILLEFIAAFRLSRRHNFSLIHAHWIIPQGIVAYMLKKILKIEYIVTTHGGDIFGLQNPIFIKMKKEILLNAKSVTVVSNAIKETVEKIDKKIKVHVISMGVDSKLFNPDKYDEKIKIKFDIHGPFLLFVGRLAEVKGVYYLIRAIPKVLNSYPNVKLLVIGEGSLKEDLRRLVRDLNLERNIEFIGPIPNNLLPKYYATSDIFIAPSINVKDGGSEGFGLTLVEAAFSGSIAIGSQVGGVSDIIINNKTGILTKEKNADNISESIIEVLRNSKLKDRILNSSRKYLKDKYDWNVIIVKFKEIFSEYEKDFNNL